VRQTSPANARDHAAESDVILDGIVGVFSGASPGLHGAAHDVVAAILPALKQRHRPLVVAVDIPSGVSADDGSVGDGIVLPADVTVTFGALKAGLLLSPGAELAGEVRLIDLGLGHQLDHVEPLVRLER
jgi:NAD(P)H-hydrate repair Nnr-like enzyme with NAD(P)H-hydrate epimerase domain